jgi:hypothetical protein
MAKILLDIVTTEMKNKEARNASDRDTLFKERNRKEKRESMLLDIYISVSRLTE